jgi:hypothetical protein
MNPPEAQPHLPGGEGADCLPPVPAVGQPVPTACGGTIAYVGGTPCILLGGQRVFFCLAVCKADFDRAPRNSCVSVGPYRQFNQPE